MPPKGFMEVLQSETHLLFLSIIIIIIILLQ